MKKIIMTLCLLVLAFNLHAERKFVLVELYHLKSTDFVYNPANQRYFINILKPLCQSGGVAEIDVTNAFMGTTPPPFYGNYSVFLLDGGGFWKIFFPTVLGGVLSNLLTAKVYCAYPIQCIKK